MGYVSISKLHLNIRLCWLLSHESWLKYSKFKASSHRMVNWSVFTINQSIKSLFEFIFSFASYASRARNRGPKVNAFLMQIEVWAIFVRLQVKIFENYSGIQMLSYFRNDIWVTCYTRHADFDELFRILKFRIFLRHFDILLSWKFSDIFSLPKQKNLESLKNFLTFYV